MSNRLTDLGFIGDFGSTAQVTQGRRVVRVIPQNDINVVAGLSFDETAPVLEAEPTILSNSEIQDRGVDAELAKLMEVGVADKLTQLIAVATDNLAKSKKHIQEFFEAKKVLSQSLKELEELFAGQSATANATGIVLTGLQKLLDHAQSIKLIAEDPDTGSQLVELFGTDFEDRLNGGSLDDFIDSTDEEKYIVKMRYENECRERDETKSKIEKRNTEYEELITAIRKATIEHEGYKRDLDNALKYAQQANVGSKYAWTRAATVVMGHLFGRKAVSEPVGVHSEVKAIGSGE